jgi:hypothetical protein
MHPAEGTRVEGSGNHLYSRRMVVKGHGALVHPRQFELLSAALPHGHEFGLHVFVTMRSSRRSSRIARQLERPLKREREAQDGVLWNGITVLTITERSPHSELVY